MTQDGGDSWARQKQARLPWLKRAGILIGGRGWALGGASGLYPSGACRSEGIGPEWVPIAGAHAAGWVTGDFTSPDRWAMADSKGRLAVVRQGRLEAASCPQLGLRGVTQIRLASSGEGWLVGEGGLVLYTSDGGASWRPPLQPLPEEIVRHFDFAAVAVQGAKVWIAGTPGSRVFYSPDAGRSWFAAATGQTLPIRALCFADDRHGYAVGSLGTILATDDGGQTWVRQRAGGTRTAVLGIFARPEDIPFELLARLAGNEGYLSAIEVVCRAEYDTPTDERVRLSDRLAEAVLRVGGSDANVAWQFPLHPSGLALSKAKTVALWDALYAGNGLGELEGWLVARIRMWRPNVIVLGDLSAAASRPEVALIQQTVLAAVRKAADADAFGHQAEQLGLPPWQVQSVYAALPAGAQGVGVIPASQLADRLGSSVGDLAEDARALVVDRYQPAAGAIAFDLVWEHGSAERAGREFLVGLAEPPDSEARRAPLFPDPNTVKRVQQGSQKRRTAQMLLQRAERDVRLAATLASQVEQLLAGLDHDLGAELLDRLAQQAWQTGRWQLAAEMDELLARRYSHHAFGRSAMLRLIVYYGSAETWEAARAAEREAIRQAGTFLPNPGPMDRQWRLQRAASLADTLQQHHPDLFATVRVLVLAASVQRQLGRADQANRLLEPLGYRTERDLWWACAQSERWLTDRRGTPSKPVLRCVPAQEPPRLDGRLDDSVWQSAAAATLHSPLGDDAAWPATVLVATDGRFLYWAIRAHWVEGSKTDKPSGPRPRDGDLAAYDRVELLVDVDRDLATWFRLSIDSRGWTRDDCRGEPGWDPTWYVASGRDAKAWTAEAAVPLDQFGKPPKPGDAWAVGIQRIVPGIGFQSWTRPAAVSVLPEGFGVICFE